MENQVENYKEFTLGGIVFTFFNGPHFNFNEACNEISKKFEGMEITEIKKIPDKCCCNTENLIKVQIPDYVESIGESAFAGCEKLVEINIPEKVTIIGDGVLLVAKI